VHPGVPIVAMASMWETESDSSGNSSAESAAWPGHRVLFGSPPLLNRTFLGHAGKFGPAVSVGVLTSC
jgi:hypothetical protein